MGQVSAVPGYASLRIVPSGLEVSVVGEVPATIIELVSQYQATFGGLAIPVTYRRVQRTAAELTDLTSRIGADQAYWKSQGAELSSWGPDSESDTVVVYLANGSPQLAAKIDAKYGDAVSASPESKVVTASSGRESDTPPWYGADLVSPGHVLACTTYFSLHSTGNGLDYNATSAHCGTGEAYNGTGYNSQGTIIAGRQKWSDGGNTDVELWPVSSNAARIWADPTTSTRLVTSRALGDVPETLLCTGGVTDAEVCSVRMDNPGRAIVYGGKTIYNQVYCEQMYGQTAFSGGDSGGPVYAGKNGSAEAEAYGMLVAADKNDAAFGYYTPLRYIFAAYSDLTFKPAV